MGKEAKLQEAQKVKALAQLEKESQRMIAKDRAEEYLVTIVDGRIGKRNKVV